MCNRNAKSESSRFLQIILASEHRYEQVAESKSDGQVRVLHAGTKIYEHSIAGGATIKRLKKQCP